jgi:MFS family permease
MKRLCALTILIGAFLLFQVQPLIGKAILPWFGSSPSVWTTTLFFFQLMLLAGYTYAHMLSVHLSIRKQVYLHLVLVAAALTFLPILPSAEWKPTPDTVPALRIILLLGATVGLPYTLLATTGPLLQRWLLHVEPDVQPFRLFAVSNTGSLLGLLSYPFFFERFLPLKHQAWFWSGGFLAFTILLAVTGVKLLGKKSLSPCLPCTGNSPVTRHTVGGNDAISWIQISIWFLLSALGTALLVATTARISQDVPAVPFLFVHPLSLYLVTFIIVFENPKRYFRPVFCFFLPLGLAAACYEMHFDVDLALWLRITLFSSALFFPCMCCHGELERAKPGPQHLTLFYLVVAVGGAYGGFFAAVFAPVFFISNQEYGLALAGITGMVMILIARDYSGDKTETSKVISYRPPWAVWSITGISLAGFAVLVGFLIWEQSVDNDGRIAQTRNFYGTKGVYEANSHESRFHKYSLYHGNIRHGFQYRLPGKRQQKTTYFGKQSGVGLAIRLHPRRAQPDYRFTIGCIGLGVGTVAAYANDPDTGFNGNAGVNDSLRFYEIDPQVNAFAETYFTYLSDARNRGAEVAVTMGDARITMEKQLENGHPQQFDVLIVDAFTGDSIPIHLLTQECFKVYTRHL